MLEAARDRWRDRIGQELVGTRLRRSTTEIGVAQQNERDAEWDRQIREVPDQADRVGLRLDPAAEDWVEQDHPQQHCEEGDEPDGRAFRSKSEERENGCQEREDDRGTRPIEAAQRHLDPDCDKQDAGGQHDDVPIESLCPRQDKKVCRIDRQDGTRHVPSDRQTASKERELERGEDEDVAGSNVDSLAEAQIVVVRRGIGDPDQSVQTAHLIRVWDRPHRVQNVRGRNSFTYDHQPRCTAGGRGDLRGWLGLQGLLEVEPTPGSGLLSLQDSARCRRRHGRGLACGEGGEGRAARGHPRRRRRGPGRHLPQLRARLAARRLRRARLPDPHRDRRRHRHRLPAPDRRHGCRVDRQRHPGRRGRRGDAQSRGLGVRRRDRHLHRGGRAHRSWPSTSWLRACSIQRPFGGSARSSSAAPGWRRPPGSCCSSFAARHRRGARPSRRAS